MLTEPDQMPHSAASDLGLHCLPITLLGVSGLKWAKEKLSFIFPLCYYGKDLLGW